MGNINPGDTYEDSITVIKTGSSPAELYFAWEYIDDDPEKPGTVIVDPETPRVDPPLPRTDGTSIGLFIGGLLFLIAGISFKKGNQRQV